MINLGRAAPDGKTAVMNEHIAAIRTRAELARRLSTELKESNAIAALIEIAESLDAEADKMEAEIVVQMQRR